MKLRIVLILLISFFITILIYRINRQDYYRVIALGDSNNLAIINDNYYGISYNDYYQDYLNKSKSNLIYNLDYIYPNQMIKDLIDDIDDNIKINNTFIKKAIHDSNKVIINIGYDELILINSRHMLNYSYINKFCSNYQLLIKELLKLNKNIIIINYPYNKYINNKYITNINDYLNGIATYNKLKIIDISNKNENYNKSIFLELCKT